MDGSDCRKKVLVTGGAGFLGREVCRALRDFQPTEIFAPRSAKYDLRERSAQSRMFADLRPNVIIHLAAVVGGIGANRANAGRYFYDNAIISHCSAPRLI
jgi:GDP-L-fucose synthase